MNHALEKPEENLTVLEESTAKPKGQKKKRNRKEDEGNRVGDEEDKKEKNINIKRGKQYLEGVIIWRSYSLWFSTLVQN